ncbi:hypothetical protein SAMN04488084_102635 [Pedobacter antarcticus]|nr:hypothetical protein SAMN04488084_102635 [Pedobacter antarcticus]SFF03864.1 hypothetical protein SAMN03003324_02196 [Pedobacter antarcticus]
MGFEKYFFVEEVRCIMAGSAGRHLGCNGFLLASLSLLLTPVAGTAAGASLITGRLSFINDALSIAGGND